MINRDKFIIIKKAKYNTRTFGNPLTDWEFLDTETGEIRGSKSNDPFGLPLYDELEVGDVFWIESETTTGRYSVKIIKGVSQDYLSVLNNDKLMSDIKELSSRLPMIISDRLSVVRDTNIDKLLD